MSLDFVAVMAGPDAALGANLLSIDARLRECGFRLHTTVANAQSDPDRGVFDETEIELHGVHSVAEIERTLNSWSGVAVEYFHDITGTIYILLGRTIGEFTNAWIEVGERTYRRTIHQGTSAVIHRAFSEVACACGAGACVVDLELPRQPLSPSELETEIESQLGKDESSASRLYLLRSPRFSPIRMEISLDKGVTASQTVEDCWLIETPAYRRFWQR